MKVLVRECWVVLLLLLVLIKCQDDAWMRGCVDAWMRGLTPCMNAGALIKNLGFGMRGFIPRINSGA